MIVSAVAKSQPSMGWVLETPQGIVGYQGSVPLLYQFGGRTLVAATAAGLVVEPAYRARCIVLLASFYRQRDVDLFVTTHTTASVASQSKALRAKALAQHDYDKVLFWVLDAHQFTKALAAKFGLRSGMAAVGTFLGSSVLRADTLRRGPRGRLANRFGVREIEVKDIGDEFEALWQRKLTETPRLFADRSPASLRWHFTLPGSSSTVAVLCCHRFERLVGYAIVLHTIDRETGMRRSMLADILVEQDDPSVTETLLEAAYSNAVASGGHLFEVVGLPRHIRQILIRWNPYDRKYPTDPLIYKTADEALARTLADVDLLAVEFNHDLEMERKSPRPAVLIARVLGDEGHLSNDQATGLLREVLRRSTKHPRHIVQLHLSRECNHPGLAAASPVR